MHPAPDIRTRVRFERYNLLDRPAPSSGRVDGHWDVILCRNVFIYFERKTVEIVVTRLLRSLSPEGHLFIGAAESLHGLDVDAVPVSVGGTWAYRAVRPGERRVPIPAPEPPPLERRAEPVVPPRGKARAAAVRKPGPAVDARRPPELMTSFSALREWLKGVPREEAIPKLQALLGHTPNHVWANLYLGFLALESGDGGGALAAFDRAHVIDPLLPEVHYCLALAYRRMGDRSQLMEALRRTVFLAPRFWPAVLLQAGLYRESGRLDLALGAYRQILEVIGMRKNDQAAFELDLPDLEDAALYREEVMALCRRSVAQLEPELRSDGQDNSPPPRGRR
jgi:chemotaxis protein methyltransferase CheR